MRVVRSQLIFVVNDRCTIIVINGKPSGSVTTSLDHVQQLDKVTARIVVKPLIERGPFVNVSPPKDHAAVRDSFIANVSRRPGDPFVGKTRELATIDTVHRFSNPAPDVLDDEDALCWIDWVINQLDLDKSAGYDGSVMGCQTKAEFVRAYHKQLRAAALNRIKRLAFIGVDAGRMTPRDLFLAGLRCLVAPAIKDELHEPRKVFKKLPNGEFDYTQRLEHPRWRSILVQGTIDHIKTYGIAFRLLKYMGCLSP